MDIATIRQLIDEGKIEYVKIGAPDIDARKDIKEMQALAPHWLRGCILRDCWFEPTFHKHVGKLCNGVQIHAEAPQYDHHAFRPWRLQAQSHHCGRRWRERRLSGPRCCWRSLSKRRSFARH